MITYPNSSKPSPAVTRKQADLARSALCIIGPLCLLLAFILLVHS